LNNEKLDICELLKVIHEEEEWEDVVPEEIDPVLTAQASRLSTTDGT